MKTMLAMLAGVLLAGCGVEAHTLMVGPFELTWQGEPSIPDTNPSPMLYQSTDPSSAPLNEPAP